jgi:hypothetical protein
MIRKEEEKEEDVDVREVYEVLSTSTLMDLLDNWEFEQEEEEEVIRDLIKERIAYYTE